MKANKRLAFYFGIAAAVLTPILPALPDTGVGSPRVVLTAVIAGLLAGAALLRGPT